MGILQTLFLFKVEFGGFVGVLRRFLQNSELPIIRHIQVDRWQMTTWPDYYHEAGESQLKEKSSPKQSFNNYKE